MTDTTTDQRATERVQEIAAGITGVQSAVTTFDSIAAGLAQIEAAHPKDVIVGDIQTTKGMQRAIESRAAWREPRLRVERIRKEAKQPVLELGRAIDAFAADLTEKLRVGEDHYDAQIKAEERRKAEEKAAREEAERKRVERHRGRIMGIRNHLNVSRMLSTAAGIRVLIDELEALPVGADFEEFEPQARVLKDETLAGLQQALNQQLEHEAETARLQAELEEQARVAAEQKRQADELEAQRRAMAEQQATLERQQREAAEALARQQAELERQRAELIEQQQRMLDQAEDQAIKADAAPVATAELAFPGTDDGRTVEEFDAAIKAENARLKAEAKAVPQETPTLTLGKITERLGFTVSRGLLDDLGFEPAGRERAAVLYHERQFPEICDALIARIQKAKAQA